MTHRNSIAYALTDEDLDYAGSLVAARSRNKTRKPNAEQEGALGEITFARVYGLALPPVVKKTSDGGVDFLLPNGATVDVKATSGEDLSALGLLVPKLVRAGLYAMVVVNTDEHWALVVGYQTGGWASAYGEDRFEHYRVDQRDLLPAEGIFPMLVQRDSEGLC